MGYSMGGMVTMELLLERSNRFRRAVIGGMGAYFASRAADCQDEEHASPPRFRRDWRADTGLLLEYVRRYDRRAMEALSKAMFDGRPPVDAGRLGEIQQPVLCVAGTRDWLCAGTRLLAERLPNCRRVLLDGRTHTTAVRDPRFKTEVAQFLWDG
jgi:pimeloyl-ACP methyl ester carboxylesterase